MEFETFKPRREQIARAIYETLTANPPEGAVAVHEPDSIGATGVDFGADGYVLVQVEDAS
jgi:2C-methyl-D-erythritol 2,4-cyclodiphosphate synthase